MPWRKGGIKKEAQTSAAVKKKSERSGDSKGFLKGKKLMLERQEPCYNDDARVGAKPSSPRQG